MAEVTHGGGDRSRARPRNEQDGDVLVLGEDVGVNGGVFRATDGLQARFGARARDRHAARRDGDRRRRGRHGGEGVAARCRIPVHGLHLSGARSGHQSRVAAAQPHARAPLVPAGLPLAPGAGIHAPEHHSESTEALFAHIPGLRVVIPSSPARAYGLLLSAIADPDPVMFFEPTRLYRAQKEEVEDNGDGLPLDICFVLREGSDVTLVSWGAMVPGNAGRGRQARCEGFSAEVIDVATLKPLDLRHDPRFGRQDRALRDRPRGAAHRGVRRGDRGRRRRARPDLAASARCERVTGYDTVVPLPGSRAGNAERETDS